MRFPARTVGLLALPALAVSMVAAPARAQDTTKAVNVGQEAPDFTAPGATRFGVLKDPIKLSDFRGQTVVLAFFFKARTKG
ncbi:MAG: redoxin domain-containing protein [Gemmatimonadaceae bacterium]|jgi:peroxiredoxin Q/BCP